MFLSSSLKAKLERTSKHKYKNISICFPITGEQLNVSKEAPFRHDLLPSTPKLPACAVAISGIGGADIALAR